MGDLRRFLQLQGRAHNAVSIAVRYGGMPRPTRCEACAATRKPADKLRAFVWHHHSYAEPCWLDVIELCAACHALVHAGSIPEPRTGRVYQPSEAQRQARTAGAARFRARAWARRVEAA